MSGAEIPAAVALAAEAGAGTAAGAGAAGAGAAAAGGAAAGAGAAGAGAGAGILGGAGTAGALGTGMYGIPLAAEGGGLIGAGGAVTPGLIGGTEAAGGLGSGMAGMSMPTAAETAPAWWETAASYGKTGSKAMSTYSTVNGAAGGNKAAPAQRPAAMPFQNQPAQQISPFSGQQQASANQFAEMLRRKLANSNNGLLE